MDGLISYLPPTCFLKHWLTQFEQPIDFMATSVVSPFCEEYINEQKVFAEDEDEYVPGNDEISEDVSSSTEPDDA